MPLKNLFRNIFLPSNSNNSSDGSTPLIDGEIVYSKNNVCVHPPGPLANAITHHPGYLTIYAKILQEKTSLVLNWIPNKGLERGKNPVDNEKNCSITPIHKSRLVCHDEIDASLILSPNLRKSQLTKCLSSTPGRKNLKPHALPPKLVQSYETLPTDDLIVDLNKLPTISNNQSGYYFKNQSRLSCSDCALHSPQISLNRMHKHCINQDSEFVFVSSEECMESSSEDSSEEIFPDLTNAVKENITINLSAVTNDCNENNCESPKSVRTNLHNTPEAPTSPPVVYNMQFPENSVSFITGDVSRVDDANSIMKRGKVIRPAQDQVRGVFNVDLSLMRSLRLFFSNDACSSGQLVIASCESQYKILHFHHGGLDNLATILEEWKMCVKQERNGNLAIHHFSICGPQLSVGQCHPEEGLYRRLSLESWALHTNEYGQIEDEHNIRKAVFFGGMESSLRHAVWPFLLKYFDFSSTCLERHQLRTEKKLKYEAINQARLSMSEEEAAVFWRSVACTIEKDVLRTDRGSSYYSGENNPNLDVLRRILLNYAVYTNTGYTQGMSDLLAPILREIQNEPDVFWCFVGLMQRTIFISSPTDDDMERQLCYLRELLRISLPEFYRHLENCGPDAMELLFTHRWILLCFKREFASHEALMMWESCWAHYQTDYFHLFICIAIIAIYGADVVENKLASDEMLLHFSNLTMQMNGQIVLRKARGLMHAFRVRTKIPCTLHDLCDATPSGMWDSRYSPMVECTSNHGDEECGYGGGVNANEVKRRNWRNFFKPANTVKN